MPRCRLTTWYYALGIDDALHHVPARVPEQLLFGSEERAGPPRLEWVRPDGAVHLLGVVVALVDRAPWAFMGRGAGLLSVRRSSPKRVPTTERDEIDQCERLARTAGHRAKVAPVHVPSLTAFLIGHPMNLPVFAAKLHPMGMGPGGFVYCWSDSASKGRWDLWEIATGKVLPGWEREEREQAPR